MSERIVGYAQVCSCSVLTGGHVSTNPACPVHGERPETILTTASARPQVCADAVRIFDIVNQAKGCTTPHGTTAHNTAIIWAADCPECARLFLVAVREAIK